MEYIYIVDRWNGRCTINDGKLQSLESNSSGGKQRYGCLVDIDKCKNARRVDIVIVFLDVSSGAMHSRVYMDVLVI